MQEYAEKALEEITEAVNDAKKNKDNKSKRDDLAALKTQARWYVAGSKGELK